MATGLENLRIYKLAEETKRGILKSARKKFIPEEDAIKIADRYTIFLKSTSAYIRFLSFNELNQGKHKTNKLNNYNE